MSSPEEIGSSHEASRATSTIGDVLANALGEVVKPGECRKYVSSVTTEAVINGNPEVSVKPIQYSISCALKPGAVITRPDGHSVSTDCSVETTPFMASEFQIAAKRYTSFSPSYSHFDLAGVVERLASAITLFATYGKLTAEQLRGGGRYSVVVLNATTQAVAATRSHVFLPRSADSYVSPNVFSAIAGAVSGEGGTLVTDCLETDTVRHTYVIPSAEGRALADGCYSALKLIGGNYDACRAGDIFAYALSRGVHRVSTVYGHTDEGSYIRRVLRQGRFSTPFGGITLARDTYSGLPRPVSIQLQGFQQLVDSIALSTAAAVACADPCVTIDGRVYPTVLVSGASANVDSGVHTTGSTADARSLSAAITETSGAFSRLYIGCITPLFGITGGNGAAERHMNAMFLSLAGCDDAHLRHAAVSPYFWIEPTSLVSSMQTGLPSAAAGAGPLAAPGAPSEVPFFSNVVPRGDTSAMYAFEGDYKSARTSGLVLHLHGHKLNGLSHLIPRQVAPERVAFIGGRDRPMRQSVAANDDYARYLWVRGHSKLPAPSEFMYTGRKMGFVGQHIVFDQDSFTSDVTHFPSYEEIQGGSVTIRTSHPNAVPSGPLAHDSATLVRSRSLATTALHNARKTGAPKLFNTVMAISLEEPGQDDDSPYELAGVEVVAPPTAFTFTTVSASIPTESLVTQKGGVFSPPTRAEGIPRASDIPGTAVSESAPPEHAAEFLAPQVGDTHPERVGVAEGL